jgi:Mg-chelatase subunit ChlI
VALSNPTDAGQRMTILRTRLDFDEHPHALAQQHAS